MRTSVAVVLGGLILSGAFPANAETLTDGRALNPSSAMGKYLFSMDFYNGMYALAQQADRAFGINCEGKYDIKPLGVAVHKPIELPDGAKQATSGVWSYRFDAVRCDQTKRYNLMMVAQPGAAPRPSMMLPGNTITSPLLAVDALRAVIGKAAVSLGSGCKEARVVDTAVAEPPHTVTEGGATYQGVWKENWTFQGCGNTVGIPVTFVPDGKGGTTFHTGG